MMAMPVQRILVCLLVIILLVSSLVPGGCVCRNPSIIDNINKLLKNDNGQNIIGGVTGTISHGEKVPVLDSQLGPDGGILTVNKPGTPIDGLSIEGPKGAFNGSQDIKVEYSTISGQTFGEIYDPVSSLIYITMPGYESSDLLLNVHIPINIPSDQFANAFYYDNENGRLYGMTILGYDFANDTNDTQNSAFNPPLAYMQLGVTTQQLSGSGSSSGNIVGINVLYKSNNNPQPVVITKAAPAKINSLTASDSGFEPKVDDWEFKNIGSYLDTGGICEGMCMGEIYYYIEQKTKLKQPSLYNLYNNNSREPKTTIKEYQRSDTLGYRFCSVLQKKFWFTTSMINSYKEFITPDSYTFYQIKQNLKTENEPQLLYVAKTKTVGDFIPTVVPNTGHAIVCYKVIGNTMYVADPNNPGEIKTIIYNPTTETFDPYITTDEKGNAILFRYIVRFDKWCLLSKDYVDSQYQLLKPPYTIGDDKFKAYTITINVKNDKGDIVDTLKIDNAGKNEYVHSYHIKNRTVEITTSSSYITSYLTNDDKNIKNKLIRDADVDSSAYTNSQFILVPGVNIISYEVFDSSNTGSWLGFDWISLTLDDPVIGIWQTNGGQSDAYYLKLNKNGTFNAYDPLLKLFDGTWAYNKKVTGDYQYILKYHDRIKNKDIVVNTYLQYDPSSGGMVLKGNWLMGQIWYDPSTMDAKWRELIDNLNKPATNNNIVGIWFDPAMDYDWYFKFNSDKTFNFYIYNVIGTTVDLPNTYNVRGTWEYIKDEPGEWGINSYYKIKYHDPWQDKDIEDIILYNKNIIAEGQIYEFHVLHSWDKYEGQKYKAQGNYYEAYKIYDDTSTMESKWQEILKFIPQDLNYKPKYLEWYD